MNKLLVSIIIPAFNSEKWVRYAIQSALSQTWKYKEIFLVDDGSTDKTGHIAREYESKNFKVITKRNGGASSARNVGLAIAQGDYIQWLDSDDILAPEKIENQLKSHFYSKTSRVLLSSAWARFRHNIDDAKIVPTSLWKNLTPRDWLFLKMNENAWMAIESWLVSRKLVEIAGIWNEQLSLDDDGEYFNRVILASDRIEFVNESMSYCRRGNAKSLSSQTNLTEDKIKSLFISNVSHVKSLLSLENSEKTREVCIKFLQRWLIYYYPNRTEMINELRDLAKSIGGVLCEPKINWKYSWIKNIFGWEVAKKAQSLVSKTKMKGLLT